MVGSGEGRVGVGRSMERDGATGIPGKATNVAIHGSKKKSETKREGGSTRPPGHKALGTRQ